MNTFKCSVSTLYLWAASVVMLGPGFLAEVDSRTAWLLMLSGVVGLAVGDACLFASLRHLGAQPAAVLMQFSPLWSAILGGLFFAEVLNWWQYSAIPVVCVGVVLVILGRARQGDFAAADRADLRVARGIFFGLLSALFNAVGALIAKQVVAEAGALRATVLRMSAACAALLLFAAVAGRFGDWTLPLRHAHRSWRELLAVFLGTFLGVWCWQACLARTEASIALCLTSTTPLFLFPLAVFFLRERYRWPAFVGTLLAVLGIPLLALESLP
jgi:drug/metabolite transporter (DMT)-like permease